MVWTIAPIAGTPSYACLGNTIIRNKLNELDSAEVQCEGTFTCDTVVQIKEGATILFQGYVKESLMEQNGKLYKLTLIETAQDLKYNIVSYLSSRSFIRTGLNVGQLVDLILSGSGWVKGTADATAVTALGFYNTTSSAALYKLLKDMQGKYVWFTVDATGVTKQVWWGLYRTDRTGAPITAWISKQLEADSVDRNITKITVYGENSTIYGSAGSGTKEKIYKYGLAKTATECTEVATKLLADLGTNKARYVLTLPKTNTYLAGDLVRVSSVNYTVHDVTRTQSNTKIGIGASDVSYRDTLGTNLEEINGAIKSPAQKTYDGGEQACNSVTGWTQNITIPDKNNVTDFKIKVSAEKFKALSYTQAQSAYLSDISQIVNSSSYSTTSFFGSGYSYLPNSYGYATTYMVNGHQFAMATIAGDWMASASGCTVQIQCEYQIGSGSWYSAGGLCEFYLGANEKQSISHAALIPGQADGTTIYVRWRIYPVEGSGRLRVYSIQRYCIQKVTRHYHSITSSYDVNSQAYGITSLGVYVGGTLVTTLSSPVESQQYEVNITAYLVTGDNTLSIIPNYKGNIKVSGSYYSV